jgi:hypothetical protein
MSIPRYRWYIRRKPTYGEGAYLSPMHVAIESADEPGTVLHVNLELSRPDNWIEPHQTALSPALVAEIIQAALSRGWEPKARGSTFRLAYPLAKNGP